MEQIKLDLLREINSNLHPSRLARFLPIVLVLKKYRFLRDKVWIEYNYEDFKSLHISKRRALPHRQERTLWQEAIE